MADVGGGVGGGGQSGDIGVRGEDQSDGVEDRSQEVDEVVLCEPSFSAAPCAFLSDTLCGVVTWNGMNSALQG